MFSIRQKNDVLGDTSVSKVKIFARPKHLKVFYTLVFLETKNTSKLHSCQTEPNSCHMVFEILSRIFEQKILYCFFAKGNFKGGNR
jgi:hypothetical protein